MGAYVAWSACISCGGMFSYNPHLVPSIRLNPTTRQYDPTSPREPVCRTCMERANAQRLNAGLDPHPILAGAYAPQDEEMS